MKEELKYISDVQQLSFPSHADKLGTLTVFEEESILPFNISRTFVVNALVGSKRGAHAHRKCMQLIVCLHGSVDIIIGDGDKKKIFNLNNPTEGLLIPASIWAEQNYIANENILMVLCDRKYEEDDYIRDYDDFVTYRSLNI